MTRLVLTLIVAYQRSGGSRRWLGIQCNFEPSCSEYTRQAVLRHGLRRGLALGWARIRRCNRPDPGGIEYDPPPEESQ